MACHSSQSLYFTNITPYTRRYHFIMCVTNVHGEGPGGAAHAGSVGGNDVIWRQVEINDLIGVQYRRVWTERAIKGCWERKR